MKNGQDYESRITPVVTSGRGVRALVGMQRVYLLGFGLGIAQETLPGLGTFWVYEGGTFGYRMIYFYFPLTRTVYAIGLNSMPGEKQDQSGHLMGTIYKTLQANNAI